jgi:NDP-sugar pyrophosphorylase family protein
MREHLSGRVHLSNEAVPLGTAGALGRLREWIDGRPVLVTNADAWHDFGLDRLVEGWDGARVRVVVVHDPARADFGEWRFAGSCLLPWSEIANLDERRSSLYERVWAPGYEAGTLELVGVDGRFVDCGTPPDYLLANLIAAGGHSVIGSGAVVRGRVERSVVWAAGEVDAGEHLVESIRATRTCTVHAPLGARAALLADRP